jgi:ATP-dependent RNA helicase DHX36
VDTGRAKEKDYDPHLKTSTLQTAWISQASAKQRKGRAGRVKAGVCFHLFSSRRYSSMRPFLESELLRTPLVSRE